MKAHHRFADFLFIVLLLLSFLIVTFISPLGTKVIVSLVNTMLPLIHIEGASGTLLQDLQLDKLTIKNKTIHIEFVDLNLDWSEVFYKNTKLNIKRLSGKKLNIYLAEKKQKNIGKTIIPTIPIPIPIDLIADKIKLAELNIINADQTLLFQVKNMVIKNGKIINNLLTADAAKATLMIKQNRMLVHLKQANLDFNQPHAIKGHGGIHYTHIQTGTFDGTVTVSGTLTDYELEGLLDWDEQILGHSNIQIKGKGDYRKANIEELIIDNESGSFNSKGKMSWRDRFKWKFNIESDKVCTKKYRSDWSAEFALALDAEGEFDYGKQKWSLLLDAYKLTGRVSNYPLQASGKLVIKDSFDLFLVKKIDLKSGDNHLKIDGKITEPMKLKWDIKANKLAQLLPDVTGKVVGKGLLTGSTINPSGEGSLFVKNLISKGVKIGLADVKLKAGADSSLRSGTVIAHIKNLKYKDFFVESTDIDFKGSEKKSLRLGRGIVSIKQLKSASLYLKSADMRFNGSPEKLESEAVLKELIIAGNTLNNTKITAKGGIDKHQIVVNSQSKAGNLRLQVKGGLQGIVWNGKILQLRLNKTAAGNWQLNKAVNVRITKKNVATDEICLRNTKKSLFCSEVKWGKELGVAVKGTIKQLSLAQLKSWLDPSIDLAGSINGSYNIQQKSNDFAQGFYGRATFQLPNSSIFYKMTTGIEEIPYRDGEVLFNVNGKRITSTAQIQFDERGTLNTQATINLSSSLKQHTISAEARFNTKNLAWLNTYFPNINKLKGELNSTVKVNGLLVKPIISATLLLKNGQIKIPDTGAYLSDIQLKISSGRKNKANINGSLLAGKGKLTMTGELDYSKRKAWLATMTLKGQDLHVMNTHEVQAYASPSINIKATPKAIMVLGSLHIPKAKITLDEIPETAIYESDDVVFTGKKIDKQKNKLRVIPNINISLGNSIQFNGFGLTGKLRGDFNVANNLNRILSRGTLSVVDGQYKAYGQVLTIEKGMLIFNGLIDNPGLNIRATRRVEDLQVGLNLAGTLQEPKSSIFSNPTLPEDEALSYLLTGQSLRDTGDANTQLFLQAISSLGISGGGNLLNRIGGSIGVDDVNVISFEDYKKNTIQLGKRLGSNVYIRYIAGLFDSFHKVAVDYQFSKTWSIQVEAGEEQAVDFIYELR